MFASSRLSGRWAGRSYSIGLVVTCTVDAIDGVPLVLIANSIQYPGVRRLELAGSLTVRLPSAWTVKGNSRRRADMSKEWVTAPNGMRASVLIDAGLSTCMVNPVPGSTCAGASLMTGRTADAPVASKRYPGL